MLFFGVEALLRAYYNTALRSDSCVLRQVETEDVVHFAAAAAAAAAAEMRWSGVAAMPGAPAAVSVASSVAHLPTLLLQTRLRPVLVPGGVRSMHLSNPLEIQEILLHPERCKDLLHPCVRRLFARSDFGMSQNIPLLPLPAFSRPQFL